MITIVPTIKENLPDIALCHQSVFPHQFLSRMGQSALIGFYEKYLRKNEVFFTAYKQEVFAGFVTGGDECQLSSYHRELFRTNPIRFFYSVITPEIIQSPFKTIFRKIRQRIRPRVIRQIPLGFYYLSVIAINENFKGKNVSGKLIASFDAECKRRNYKGYYLKVSAKNARAIAFYQKMGMSVLNNNGSILVMIKSFS